MSTKSKLRSRAAAQHRASSTVRSPSHSTARAASHNGIAGEVPAVPSRRPPTRTRTRTQARGYGRGRRGAALSFQIKLAAVVGVAVAALAVIFVVSRGGLTGGTGTSTSRYAYTVGNPGPGTMAPMIQLPSTAGGTFDLSALRGKTVLLYFQEGLTCQPCWDQLKDIDSHMSQFRALGIDEVVSITTDQLGPVQQKVADEGITSPVLSDPHLTVSQAYNANQYGMMGASRDGHTFIVVGPDGRIRWRADFGGAPNYTMYVPISNLIADLRQGMTAALTGATVTTVGSVSQ